MSNKENKSVEFPFLGRMMNKFDTGNSMKISLIFLAIVCLILFLCDFAYKKYGHYPIEELQGFYGLCGFAIFSFIIFFPNSKLLFISTFCYLYSNRLSVFDNIQFFQFKINFFYYFTFKNYIKNIFR